MNDPELAAVPHVEFLNIIKSQAGRDLNKAKIIWV